MKARKLNLRQENLVSIIQWFTPPLFFKIQYSPHFTMRSTSGGMLITERPGFKTEGQGRFQTPPLSTSTSSSPAPTATFSPRGPPERHLCQTDLKHLFWVFSFFHPYWIAISQKLRVIVSFFFSFSANLSAESCIAAHQVAQPSGATRNLHQWRTSSTLSLQFQKRKKKEKRKKKKLPKISSNTTVGGATVAPLLRHCCATPYPPSHLSHLTYPLFVLLFRISIQKCLMSPNLLIIFLFFPFFRDNHHDNGTNSQGVTDETWNIHHQGRGEMILNSKNRKSSQGRWPKIHIGNNNNKKVHPLSLSYRDDFRMLTSGVIAGGEIDPAEKLAGKLEAVRGEKRQDKGEVGDLGFQNEFGGRQDWRIPWNLSRDIWRNHRRAELGGDGAAGLG